MNMKAYECRHICPNCGFTTLLRMFREEKPLEGQESYGCIKCSSNMVVECIVPLD